MKPDNGKKLCKGCPEPIKKPAKVQTHEILSEPNLPTEHGQRLVNWLAEDIDPSSTELTMATEQFLLGYFSATTDEPLATTQSLNSNPQPTNSADSITCRNCKKKMGQPLIDQDKLIETLGVDPEEWSFGYEVKYTQGKWRFDILLKNLQDNTLNKRIHAGVIG